MWYIYTMEYQSAIKKNMVMPSKTTWMELETLILSQVSQREKDKSHVITHMWNLKCGTDEPIYNTDMHSQTWRTHMSLPRGREWDGMGVWVSRCKLLHRGCISSEVLLNSKNL